MSVETFMQQLQALNSSLETLAAIGAELRLRRDGLTGALKSPRVGPYGLVTRLSLDAS
jgi:hypothetical protein